MTKAKKEIKVFNIRMPYEIWKFLKTTAVQNDISMADIVINCVEKYKKKLDNKLTD